MNTALDVGLRQKKEEQIGVSAMQEAQNVILQIEELAALSGPNSRYYLLVRTAHGFTA
jgi:hypothetical protein